MRKRKLTSITAHIHRSVWSVASLLVIPVVIGLVMMLIYTQRYQAMIQRMDTAAELKPKVETELPRDLFSVAAGRVDFADSGIEERVAQINSTLETLLAETDGSGAVQLTVARRTMDTMWHYAEQVRDGMAARQSISEIEKIVDEVWQVGELVGDKIDAFLADEITAAAQASRNMRTALLVAACVECLLLLFALLWTHNETRRLSASIREALLHLENTVSRIAEGRFQERVGDMEVKELQNLTDQINLMAARLEGLIEQNRQKQEHLAKAELRTLQAQINPHFLYNTLDAIVWKAEAGEQQEVIQLTRALSDFFRISLSSGADWIPISQEKKHIVGYLNIQKTRYRDILDVQIDIPEEMDRFYILKLLLQPLVENALYHGIKYKRGGGTIRVTGRMEDGMLTFTVSDTGKGMDGPTLEALRARMAEKQLAQTPGVHGFGLVNVNLRIRLYYNQPEGLHIESGPEGTNVIFRVPCRTREEIENDQSLSG